MREQGSEKIYQIFLIISVSIVALISLYPITYVLSLSLTGEEEWLMKNGFVLWPSKPTFLAYTLVIRGTSVFLNSMIVSVVRTVLGTTTSLVFTIITGYVLSKKDLPGRRIFLFLVLFTILFRGGLIPTFIVVKQTGLLNSIWALIIPELIGGWYVLVFKQFFEALPKELEESAHIDGAGEITLMMKIILPMSKPVIAAIGLFIAIFHWNSWFDALVYIRDTDLMPIQLLLRNMFANTNMGFDMNVNRVGDASLRVSTLSLRMAVTVIGTLPILCIYPFLQKHFVKGVYMGAVKG